MNPFPQTRVHPRRPLIWSAAASVLFMFALAGAILIGPRGPEPPLAFLLGVPAAWLMLRGIRWAVRALDNSDLFSPFVAFPLAYVLWFGFGSIAIVDDSDPLPYGYIAGGLVCYLVGVWCFRSRGAEACASDNKSVRSDWDPGAFWTLIVLMSALSFTTYLYLIYHIGIPALSSAAGEQRLEIVKHGPVQAVLFTSVWTVTVFLAVHLRKGESCGWKRWISLALIVVLSVLLLSLGGRANAFVGLLTGFIACYYVGPRFKLRYLLPIGALTFVCLSLYGYMRDTSLTKGYLALGAGDSAYEMALPLYYSYEYVRGPSETFRNVTQLIPSQVPYQYGALTFAALKTVLPGHHEMSDMFFKSIQGHEFIGLGEPATLLGPFYGDFGVLGIVIGMFLFGALWAKVHRWMLADPTIFRAAIYGWFMQTALFSLFGSLFQYITALWIPLFWFFADSLIRRRTGQTVLTRMRGRGPDSEGALGARAV